MDEMRSRAVLGKDKEAIADAFNAASTYAYGTEQPGLYVVLPPFPAQWVHDLPASLRYGFIDHSTRTNRPQPSASVTTPGIEFGLWAMLRGIVTWTISSPVLSWAQFTLVWQSWRCKMTPKLVQVCKSVAKETRVRRGNEKHIRARPPPREIDVDISQSANSEDILLTENPKDEEQQTPAPCSLLVHLCPAANQAAQHHRETHQIRSVHFEDPKTTKQPGVVSAYLPIRQIFEAYDIIRLEIP
jgi:hypothetical protein